ncbi:hypothetical protein KFK09_016447 [Dendrobium nobile]|uniref:Uncharacterized protein n=1 Tax=Dendrobium nobile TaxID=94219 RepID=A0A8T3B0P9_DENNO|nr:hypothetical protein KFK09_016447 [Dendrobium nobile]
MEKILKNHDKERMKRAMIEQEETFRQQVNELHRLYRVQKQLMKEMKINKLKKDKWTPKTMEIAPRRMLDLELPAEAHNQYNDEREIELTLAIGSSSRKGEEKSNTSDSAGSFSSSSAESGSLKLLGHDWGISKVPEMYLTSHREMNNGFDDEHEMRQDRLQKPPWFLPCLSLTMS